MKVIYIADELDDTSGLAKSFIEAKICSSHKLEFKDLNYHFYSLQCGKSHNQIILEIPNWVLGADVVLFDYGGFDVMGQNNYRLIDYYSRFFIKLIEENPSKEWWCTSALPKNCFAPNEIEQLQKIGVNFVWVN